MHGDCLIHPASIGSNCPNSPTLLQVEGSAGMRHRNHAPYSANRHGVAYIDLLGLRTVKSITVMHSYILLSNAFVYVCLIQYM